MLMTVKGVMEIQLPLGFLAHLLVTFVQFAIPLLLNLLPRCQRQQTRNGERCSTSCPARTSCPPGISCPPREPLTALPLPLPVPFLLPVAGSMTHQWRQRGPREPASTAQQRCWQWPPSRWGTVPVENPANSKAPHGNEALIRREGIIFLKDRKEIRAFKKGI